MKTCKQCILDERFPGVSFDDDGACNFCRTQIEESAQEERRTRYDQKFRALIEEHRGSGSYDCLVAYSGGKDSTYTLHLLKERYDVRILAFSLDNWYQSDAALQNIKTVMKSMAIDHLTVMPSFELVKGIIQASVTEELHSPKALIRASAICTTCISVIRSIAFRMAVEQRIPFVVFGMSPGQAPLPTSIVKANPKLFRAAQENLLRRLRACVGPHVETLFLTDRHFDEGARFPYSVNPLAFVPYDESVIYDVIQSYGWSKPEDTDPNSTNCLLNAVANRAHFLRYGYNPYAYEVAEFVRSGRVSRSEGLRRLDDVRPGEVVDTIVRELELQLD